MKFYTSAIIAALLVAAPLEAQAIRLVADKQTGAKPACDDADDEDEGSYESRTIKKAMDKFVAKH